MPIHITIDAATATEAREHMFALLGYPMQSATTLEVWSPDVNVRPAPAPVDEPAPAPTPAAAAAAEQKPRKAKAAKVEVTVEPAPAPTPAEAVQDKKDEAPAASAPAKEATIDDVRNAMGGYVKKYGMAAAQQDGPALLAKLFGDGCKKISDIPNTPAMYSKAIAAIEEMLTKNPHNRAAV